MVRLAVVACVLNCVHLCTSQTMVSDMFDEKSVNSSEFDETGNAPVNTLLQCSLMCLNGDCNCFTFEGENCRIGHCRGFAIFGKGIKNLKVHVSVAVELGECQIDTDCFGPVNTLCRSGKCAEPAGVLMLGGTIPLKNVELLGNCDVTVEESPLTNVVQSSATIVNGKIYHCGGLSSSTVLSLCYIREISGTWTAGPSFTQRRRDFTLNTVGSKLVATGRYSSFSMDTIEVLDSGSTNWVVSPTRLNPPRHGHCAVTISPNSILLITGGSGSSYLPIVQSFNIETGEITDHPDFPVLMDNPACCVYDGQVVVSGGFIRGGTVLSSVHTMELSPLSGNWKSAPPMIHTRAAHIMLNVKGVLMVFGGKDHTTTQEELVGGRWVEKPLIYGGHDTAVIIC